MILQSNIDKLKAKKKELNWTNSQLAEAAGVPVGTVNKILCGDTKSPRPGTVASLVKALGLSLYDMEDFGNGVSVIREPATAYHGTGEDSRATLETYYSLPEDVRAELIDGKIYYMSAPSVNHQLILNEFSAQFYNYFKQKKSRCRGYQSPCDVRLDRDDYTMLQPDFFTLCDKDRISEDGAYLNGAPDFVLEVVSPSNPRHDYFLKLQKYQSAGVREYWIVDPGKRRVLVYVFEQELVPVIYSFQEQVPVNIYPDLVIDFSEIAAEMG